MVTTTTPSDRNTAAGSSIDIDHRTSRSLLTATLQTGLKPFKKYLTSYHEQPGGSPELTPHKSVYEHCTVHERIVQDIRIYDINVRSASTDRYVAYAREARDPNLPNPSTLYKHQSSTVHLSSPAPSAPVQQQFHVLENTEGHSNLHASNPFSHSTSSLNQFHEPRPSQLTTSDETPRPPRNETQPSPSGGPSASASDLHLAPTKTRDFAHKQSSTRPRPRSIYYFCGGSWNMPPSKDHWKLVAHLAVTLTKQGTPTTVSVVSHPLAPKSPAIVAFPMMEKLYYELFSPVATTAPDPNNKDDYLPADVQIPEVILAGDSSGGNVALGLTLDMLCTHPDA